MVGPAAVISIRSVAEAISLAWPIPVDPMAGVKTEEN
jgi:hypothetical protein